MADIGYVTLLDADSYIAAHFISTDPLRIAWNTLGDPDKSVLLQRSFDALETLPFTGKKTSTSQLNAFPRCPTTEVPQAVKSAQIENALALNDPDNADDMAFYSKLWKYGVESYSIGNLSERVSTGSYGAATGVANGVVSSKAMLLLQPYLNGGYRIGQN